MCVIQCRAHFRQDAYTLFLMLFDSRQTRKAGRQRYLGTGQGQNMQHLERKNSMETLFKLTFNVFVYHLIYNFDIVKLLNFFVIIDQTNQGLTSRFLKNQTHFSRDGCSFKEQKENYTVTAILLILGAAFIWLIIERIKDAINLYRTDRSSFHINFIFISLGTIFILIIIFS